MGTSISSMEDVNATPSFNGNSSQLTQIHSKKQWKARLDASLQTNKLLVVDFTATWCGPCKAMEPILKDFAATYTDVEFIKIDVDTFIDLAKEYQIDAMPTFVLIKKGVEIDRIVGAVKDDLQKKIEKYRI